MKCVIPLDSGNNFEESRKESEILTDPISGLQIVFSLTYRLTLTTDLFSGEKILSRVCLHYFSIPSTENFVRNETLQIYYGASVRISAFKD